MNRPREIPQPSLDHRLAAARLTPTQRQLVQAVQAFIAEAGTTGMRPSRAMLARSLGQDPLEVFTDLQRLVAAGILTARPRRGAAATYDLAPADPHPSATGPTP